MADKTKSKKIGNKSLTGRQLVAQIFGNKPQHISDTLNDRKIDNKGIAAELELYSEHQKAYIEKRKIILGFSHK